MADETRPFQRLFTLVGEMLDQLGEGGKVLPEPQLAKKLGVSRATLREVLRIYERQGRIQRRQGKGTFVAGNSGETEPGLEALEPLERLAQRAGLSLEFGPPLVDEVPAEGEAASALGLRQSQPLTRVARLANLAGRPLALLIDLFPTHVLRREGLEDDLDGSVLAHLLARPEIDLGYQSTRFEALAAPPEIARALGASRGSALLLLTSTLYSSADLPLGYSKAYYLSGKLSFRLTQRPHVWR